jgi:hypothetical protein
MDARYNDGEGMSDEIIVSESMQLLVADMSSPQMQTNSKSR